MKLTVPPGIAFALLTMAVSAAATVVICYMAGMNREERDIIKGYARRILRRGQKPKQPKSLRE